MLVSDLDPNVVRGGGAALGIGLGLLATKATVLLPRRYGITHVVTARRAARRNVILVLGSALCSLGIAQVVTRAPELSVAHATFVLATNAVIVAVVLAAAAIDVEHMILPNELTLGAAALCIVTSPLRSIGLVESIAGALTGLAISYLPLLLYKKIRGESGMGLGDAKLTAMAGAWHGVTGAILVLFAGALQSSLTAVGMRMFGIRYDVPESVQAELAELRARAEAGDEEAKRDLADDPMAAEARDGTLAMRLPLGPFLALACIEVLFLRRWIGDHMLAWLER